MSVELENVMDDLEEVPLDISLGSLASDPAAFSLPQGAPRQTSSSSGLGGTSSEAQAPPTPLRLDTTDSRRSPAGKSSSSQAVRAPLTIPSATSFSSSSSLPSASVWGNNLPSRVPATPLSNPQGPPGARTTGLHLSRQRLGTKNPQYSEHRPLRLGVVISNTERQRGDFKVGVIARDGSFHVFNPESLEQNNKYKQLMTVAFQTDHEDETTQPMPFNKGHGKVGTFACEMTSGISNFFEGRAFIQGLVGELKKAPPSIKNPTPGSYYEIQSTGDMTTRYTMRLWQSEAKKRKLKVEEGQIVQFATSFRNNNADHYPSLDEIRLDNMHLEKLTKHATDDLFYEKMRESEEFKANYEIGGVEMGSNHPLFPAAMECELNYRDPAEPLISQMLRLGYRRHLDKQHEEKGDLHAPHTTGVRRFKKAYSGISTNRLTVIINPFNFNHIGREEWPRLIDEFFTGQQAKLVKKFLLLAKVDNHTTLENALVFNDFDYRFKSDVKNRLEAIHVIDTYVPGVAHSIGDMTSILYNDWGTNEKYAVLSFGPKTLSHVSIGTVGSISSRRSDEEVEYNSNCQLSMENHELLVYASFEEGDNGAGRRDAMAYLNELRISFTSLEGSSEGWGYLQIRCENKRETAEMVARLMEPPEQGEIPLLAISANTAVNRGIKLKFDDKATDIFNVMQRWDLSQLCPWAMVASLWTYLMI